MTIGRRILPKQADNRFGGHRSALWLLGLFGGLKVVMSVNSIVNTAAVAAGADGFPLESYGPEAARAVLLLFAMVGLGQLALAAVALTALVRYRALVPFVYLVLLAEQLARRWLVESHAVARTEASSAAGYVGWALLALLTLGLILSLRPALSLAKGEVE